MPGSNVEVVHVIIESIDYATNSYQARVIDPGHESHRSFHCEWFELDEEDEEMIGQTWEVTLEDSKIVEMSLMSVEDSTPPPVPRPPCS